MKILLLFLLLSQFAFSQDCEVEKQYDKFTEETTYTIKDKKLLGTLPVNLIKTIKNDDTTYSLFFIVFAGDYLTTPRGVFVIFEDGTKWAEADHLVAAQYAGYSKYMYYASLPLDEEKIEKLLSFRITDIKVGQNELSIKKKDSDYIHCGIKKIVDY